MEVEKFILALGLSDVADVIHKHPKSGSDYSLRTLLEKFNKKQSELIAELINACDLALSHLTESSNEITREEFLIIETAMKKAKIPNES